jgi:soluble lytic murein transglycosylase
MNRRSPLRLAGALVALIVLTASAAAQIGPAAQALEAGRPWLATQLLRPIVADHTRAPAGSRLLAARAAAAWQGWSQVERLLGGTAWPTAADERTARELLARAALARQANRDAADHLRVALDRAGDPGRRGILHALLGRAHDRLEASDSAATHYLAAAGLLPEIADWLLLRAAIVTPDSAARAGLYRRVRLEAAASRLPWAEASALQRAGEHRGAALRFDLLGARTRAIQARLEGTPAAGERATIRARILELLAPGIPAADARTLIGLLDRHFAPLTSGEQLVAARRAAAAGDRDRAIRGFTAARDAPDLRDTDRLAWGAALAQLGRHSEAIALLATIRDPAVAGAAAYQRARSLLSRSGARAAMPVLQEIPDRWPDDTASAAVALYLTGDLLADQGDWASARAAYQRVASSYPTTTFAARGQLEAGTIAYAHGDLPEALEAFLLAAERFPAREEGSAGAYWAGRIEAQRGDTAAARARWRALVARVPHSYYALAAASRLGEPAWAPAGAATRVEVPPGFRATMARAALLGEIGFDPEQQHEIEHLLSQADRSNDLLIAAAQALHDAGHAARGLTTAQRAFSRGAERTPVLYRLLFPVPQEEIFRDIVTRRGLDPWLVAGLIRQESGFDPRARSVADARGLMQVLPSVGAPIARRLGWTEWDPVLLYEPEVSLTLGTRHLEELVRRYPDPIRVLAAYNAGGTRVARWEGRPGVARDPELFLEMIPFLETRNYVRRVLRNAAFYRSLYGEEGEGRREK